MPDNYKERFGTTIKRLSCAHSSCACYHSWMRKRGQKCDISGELSETGVQYGFFLSYTAYVFDSHGHKDSLRLQGGPEVLLYCIHL